AVRPRRAFELPLVEPQLFGGAVGRFGVEHAIVGDDALEASGVTFYPVRRITAITCAQRALAVLVDEGIVLLGVVESEHQVLIRRSAPIAVDGVDELLAISS